jgi:hypothetical protein
MSLLTTLTKKFPDGRQALAVYVPREVHPAAIVAALELPKCSRLLFICGGAENMPPEILNPLVNLFAEVGRLVRDDSITVIDGGTEAGVMRLMGQALRQAGAAVTHIGILPAQAAVDDNGTRGEDILDPNHNYFVLVEGNEWGDETEVMYRLGDYLAADIPSIAVLINGGGIALQEIEKNVEQGREIVVITGSGRLADEIAEAVFNPGPHIRPRVAAIARDGRLTLFNLIAPPNKLAEILKQRLTKFSDF